MSSTKSTRNNKLVIKRLTLRNLTPEEIGEIAGGACSASLANCISDHCRGHHKGSSVEITKHPKKRGWSWTVGITVSLSGGRASLSASVSLGPSYSYSWTA